ncbi:serine/threonine-protein kinase [Streptomyces turgidiscabies]|uniref:non-specific serine/threonine protein kinase n=1 Tax=Streptomyces turgidiscabies (strain Car8) TaxID=698760 RepID=L7EVG7_STRT8|nr:MULTISPECIES: serine/threonine-protein kinase [Streptomyces]ELP62874.1 kinase domain protein [Streptomyces turgidiscabies Car8]MDX3495553.1 serine/threonine-protein kinase [Streptomyces turgidiscabies]GAQ70241.1 serine/threonine-protein kinase PknK [Streptomyces turgidiscabies]
MQFERTGVPGYEVVAVLGQGGFATVYRARQLAVGREVALKMDSRVLATDRDRQRFLREVTAAGQLSGHPHVVAVYDAGVLDTGRPYMVLELCPGGSLGDRLHREGPLPVAEARDIGVRIADALAAAHAGGVLHRDIKPGNIMIDRYGNVGLADFGLAAMPRPGQELSVTREALTPAYAPPEAFRLAEPTPAGDVYSLAATIYALVHGRPPHFPEDGSLGIAEVIVRHTWPLPDLPGVHPRFTEVLRHAMAPDPADRLPSAAALRDALAAVDLAGPTDPAGATAVPFPVTMPGPAAVPPTTVVPPAVSPRRRTVRVRLSVAAVAVVVVGTGGTMAYQYLPPSTTDAPTTSASTPASASASGGATQATIAGYGVPTTTENCPATDVAGMNGRCTTTAECWGGMVVTVGIVSVNRSDCLVSHPWETFAIAPLPSTGMTNNQRELENHPDVRRLCSRAVLARSRQGDARNIDPSRWTVDVLPPTQTEYADGLRVLRCVATITGEESTGAHFRPRT